MWLGLTDMLYVDVPLQENVPKPIGDRPGLHWQGVLYHGEEGGTVPHTYVRETLVSEK
jgi:hypothetical protein